MFRISWTEKASKQLAKLPRIVGKHIFQRVDELQHEPRGSGVKRLGGSAFYRLRVGDYRVIFDIQDRVLVVLVLEVGHRKKIYK